MNSANNKRILRNAGMLYARMLLIMGITLYTSRVILELLGDDEFGIFQVIVGIVALLGFLQGAMASTTQRYIAYDLGTTGSQLNQIFTTSLVTNGILATGVIAAAQTVGYWFIENHINIPQGREDAVLSAYHLITASFALSILITPFSAVLISHERMGIFASISVFDAFLKLAAVIALDYIKADKLISYAALLFGTTVVTSGVHLIYHIAAFPDISLTKKWHTKQAKNFISFTGWNIWGNLASTLSTQGTNILLNVFFGPTLNASRAISIQANTALNSFVQSIQAAINPQIIKLYASGDVIKMHRLLIISAKYNFFLLFTLALPAIVHTEALLEIWLVKIPPHTTTFLQLIIINSLIDSLSNPLMTSAQATGNIRMYQTVVGGILLFNIPISYILLLNGRAPETVMLVSICLSALALFVRLEIIAPLISLRKLQFFRDVLGRSILVVTTSALCAITITQALPANINRLAISMTAIVLSTITIIWIFGTETNERKSLLQLVRQARKKLDSH